MDYPDYDTAVSRFIEQGVLSIEEITSAMNNTNVVEEFEDIVLDTSLKIPTMYPNATQEYKNKILTTLLTKQYRKLEENIPESMRPHYISEIRKEVSEIVGCDMADYFLLDYEIIKRGIEVYNGVLTRTGRGSATSMYLNRLLNFTQVDRISSPIPLFYERFLTKDRIIESKTSPDIDMNVSAPEPFIQAQKDLLGEQGTYPLLALGKLKLKSAFKMYARANNVPPDIANEVSKQIAKYEKAVYHNEDIEIDVYDYVDKAFEPIIEGCKEYLGITVDRKQHPCFLADELVMTRSGLKKIIDVTTDDYVLTHNNQFKKVVEVMENTSSDIYKVRVAGAFPIQVTGSHPFYVRERKNKQRRGLKNNLKNTPIWKTVDELDSTDMVGIAINQSSIIPDNKEYNLPFNNPNFWWLIGRYLGDGWYEDVKNRTEKRLVICCSKVDDAELNEITSRLDGLLDYRCIEERTTYKVFIKNIEMFEFVKQFGKYAYGKKLNSTILDLPVYLLESVLDGYLSADGHHIVEKDRYSFKTVSKELATGFIACVAKVYHRHCNVQVIPAKTEYIEGRKVKSKEKYEVNFSKYPRKQDKAFYEDGYIWVKFRDKTPLDTTEKVYNLSVVDDNSYTVNNIIVHNCGFTCTNLNVEEEIGLILCKSESTKNEVLVALLESSQVDRYGWLKNDFLTVSVVDNAKKIYDRIGITPLTIDELIKVTENNTKVWDIYKNGLTLGINQVEQEATKLKAMKYAPVNYVELTYLVAAIRPSFKSMYSVFESRQPFSYGIKTLDNILQTKYMPYSFIIFQEHLMQILAYAGLEVGETYTIIKAISKKKHKVIAAAKDKFINGFGAKIKEDELKDGHCISDEEVEEMCNKVWRIIEDNASYGFNSSHALCVALDSLDGAYLKAHYPYEFYETMLKIYTAKGEKDKVTAFKNEMKHFGIKCGALKFGEDNRDFTAYKDKGIITQSLKAIKGINQAVANTIYDLSQQYTYKNFADLLFDIKASKKIDAGHLKTLIELDYFSMFGGVKKLKKIVEIFNTYFGKSQFSKDKFTGIELEIIQRNAEKETTKLYKGVNSNQIIRELALLVEEEVETYSEIATRQYELLGDVSVINPSVARTIQIVLDIDTKYSPKLTLYSLATGKINTLKCNKHFFDYLPLQKFDTINVKGLDKKQKGRYVDGKWTPIEGEHDIWIKEYSKIIA